MSRGDVIVTVVVALIVVALIGWEVWNFFSVMNYCNSIGGTFVAGKNIWPTCFGGNR